MILALAFTSALLAQVPSPRPPRQTSEPPLPQGQRIEVHDGDTVIVRDGARVKLVYRREAHVRAVYNASQHWLLLLVDYATNGAPDGGVDQSYTFHGLEGDWPLGERWEGSAVVDDYASAGQPMTNGVGITVEQGFFQILQPTNRLQFRDDRATVLAASGFGRGGGGNRPFDEIERTQAASATMNYERNKDLPRSGVSTYTSGMAMSGGSSGLSGALPAPGAPVRVGGTIRPPERLVYVPAVYPEQARAADTRGVVILEIVIGPDGSVSDAKVLRSIPLLDQAALDAARQWRYAPTLLNGNPVPVIMTVTVSFP